MATARGGSIARLLIPGLFLGAGLLACGPGPPPLRVGLPVWPPYDLAVVAQELELLDRESVQLVDFRSPGDMARLYRAGQLDAIAATLEYALEAAQHEPEQRIVFVIDVSLGGDMLLAREDVATIADLRGRRIGVESGPLGASLLLQALQRAALSLAEVELVPVDVPDGPEALRSGRVDAMLTYAPFAQRIVDEGGHVLFSSRDVPGRIVDVLITRAPVLRERTQALRSLIDGWLAAQELLAEDPERVARLATVREEAAPGVWLGMLEEARLVGRAENVRLLSGEDPTLARTLQDQASFLLQEGVLQRPVETASFLDDRLVRRIAP